jgi:hypothetical protein
MPHTRTGEGDEKAARAGVLRRLERVLPHIDAEGGRA